MQENCRPKLYLVKPGMPLPAPSGEPSSTPPARTKRELLTPDQYEVARVLANIITGRRGYRSQLLTVADDERACLREQLLNLARHLGMVTESFLYRPTERKRALRSHRAPEEAPIWPHRLFVACIKYLNWLRSEGRPDEHAEKIVRDLTTAAERHKAASRSHSPDKERDHGTRETNRGSHFRALRRMLTHLNEQDGRATESTASDDEWPEYIYDGREA